MEFIEVKDKRIGEGTPLICVPIVGRTYEDIIKQAEEMCLTEYKELIDIVEFRADFFEELSKLEILEQLMLKLREKLKDKILLFTIRSEKEGGNVLAEDITDIDEINRFIISNGLADIVDIELADGDNTKKEIVKLAHKNGVKVILSYHNFSSTPNKEYIMEKYDAMSKLKADICKVAVMPKNIYDVYTLMEAATNTKEMLGVPMIAISMGAIGAITRISGGLFGSDITFAALDHSSAPGQIPIKTLKSLITDIQKYCI